MNEAMYIIRLTTKAENDEECEAFLEYAQMLVNQTNYTTYDAELVDPYLEVATRIENEIDNRDQCTTWLQLEGTGDYTEIDPQEVMANMIENCYNEDILFLFERFQVYLAEQDSDDVKDDVSTDHIAKFRDWLTDMIESNKG